MASDSPSSKSYSTDPALYIYTSLTAGSSHIFTATSRLETILRANKVPFKAIDIATDEKARMLWGRRAGKAEDGHVRKLPGLVQSGMVLGDLVEIEEWNEYGELKQNVTIFYDEFTQPPISQKPKTPPPRKPVVAPAPPAPAAAPAAPPLPSKAEKSDEQPKSAAATVTMPIRSIAEEAAARAKQVHLQSLRDKVYGKSGSDTAGKEPSTADEAKKAEDDATTANVPPASTTADESADAPTQPAPSSISLPATTMSEASLPSVKTQPGLQSPTTGAWKDDAATDDLLRTLQSPTSTSWKPTDIDAPITSYHGSRLSAASEEEIKAVEKEMAIEEEAEEEDDDDDDGEEEKKK